MLVEMFLALSYYILSPILSLLGTAFNITGINELLTTVITNIDKMLDVVLQNANSLIWLVFGNSKIFITLLTAIITIEIAIGIYKTVMWCVKKIPMMSIK